MYGSARATTRSCLVSASLMAALVGALAGCDASGASVASDEDTDARPPALDASPTTDTGAPATQPPAPDAAPGPAPDAIIDAATPPEPDAAPSPTPDATPPAPMSSGPGLPCDVNTVIATHCGQCHGETPTFGAPMPLVTRADLLAPAPSDPARVVLELALERMQNERQPMPPLPNPGTSENDFTVLALWAEAGAPEGEVCGVTPVPPDDGWNDPLPPPNPECDQVVELRAHGNAVPSDAAPYPVPAEAHHYVSFTFQMPWMVEAQGLEFHPIIDDERVLDHWLLYADRTAARRDGDIVPGIASEYGRTLVAAWAPGDPPTILPENVGLELPSGRGGQFVLEMHYRNAAGVPNVADRSGVRVCASTRRRPETAAVYLLGTEFIPIIGAGEFRATGLCMPWGAAPDNANRDPVRILSSAPRMHRRGRHLTTRIHRANGVDVDTLVDAPFDFDHQRVYPTPEIIFPGDRLETVCTFENEQGAAIFGAREEDEVCQNYIVASPVGPLDTGGSISLNEHACML